MHPGNQWEYVDFYSFGSGKVYLTPLNPSRELEVEIAMGSNEDRMYLNAFGVPFPHEEGDEKKAKVTYTIDGEKNAVIASRLEGGQKLLIPSDARDEIISALLENCAVTISSGRYRTQVVTIDFNKYYSKV